MSYAPGGATAAGLAKAERCDEGDPRSRRAPASLEEAIRSLGECQLMLHVPSVEGIRQGRPLRRYDDELWVAQFVLQSTRRNFDEFLASEEGKCEFHPFLQKGSAGGCLPAQGDAAQVQPDVADGPNLVGDQA